MQNIKNCGVRVFYIIKEKEKYSQSYKKIEAVKAIKINIFFWHLPTEIPYKN